MEKQITTAVLLLTTAMFFASCGSNTSESDREKTEQTANAMYQCPMDCEEGKTYDKPGQCPVCNMDLKEVEGGHAQHGHDSTHKHH